MSSMIIVKDLVKHFKSGSKVIKAVDGASFELGEGVLVSIIGKSGSGKTTLLNLLGALDRVDSGSITIDGMGITKLKSSQLDCFRRKTVGFIFQSYNLIPNLSASENVMLPMEFAGVPRRKRRERARKLLLNVGIDELRQRHRPPKLSGGEQQRVAIARALANQPAIILADEPTGNLDTETGREIVMLLKKVAKQENTTVIVATHDAEIARKSQKVFYLKDGRLVPK